MFLSGSWWRFSLLLCIFCFIHSGLLASGPVVMVYPDPPAIPPMQRDKPLWRVSMDSHYQNDATVPDTNNGQLSRVDATAKVEYFLRTREQFVSAFFSYRWRSMNWSSAPNYITDTGAYELNILAFQSLGNDDWSFVGLANTYMEAEYNGGDIPDSTSYMFGAGIQYELTPRLHFGLGATVSDSPMNTLRFWPLVLLQWKINQQLVLSSSNGLLLVYEPDLDKRTRLDFAVRYHSHYMGLHSQETAPGQSGRPIVQDTAVDLVAGFERQLNDWLRIRVAIDGRVYNEYEFYQNSNQYRTLRPEPSVGFSIRASVSF